MPTRSARRPGGLHRRISSVLAAGLIVVLFAQGVNALFIAAAAISAACAVPDFMAARQIGKENAAAKEKAET